MRGFGSLLFIAFVIGCGLSVSGLVLQKAGVTDQMVAEFAKKEGWGTGTRWTVERQAYAFTVLGVRRGADKQTASGQLLLIGGVPVRTLQPGAFGLAPAGATTP